ncbi:MAG: APC family permease, partial [Terriglobales bacterium]
VLESPYRFIISPIVGFVQKLEAAHPNRQLAVVVPEIVDRHWYHFLFFNHHATALKALLLLQGNQRTIVVNVPWYLK